MEKEWVERSRRGDEEAFAELVALYRPRIYQECFGILREKTLAEDVTQESFIRAYNHLGNFQGRSSFYTWLWRIAHNACIDVLKKQRPHSEIHEEQIAGKKESSKEDLIALLPLLPRKHARVFELFYIKELSQKEIATSLSLPYGTVRSRLHYARKKIRRFRSKA